MLIIVSWTLFIVLTVILVGSVVYVTGLFVGPLFGAPYVSSDPDYGVNMVRLSRMQPGQHVADLGCGDGRIVRAFANQGAHAVGYEINPLLVWYARWNTRGTRRTGSARIMLDNFMVRDLSQYDVITAYLMPPIISKLEQKLFAELKPGARVISIAFPFPNWKPIIQEGRLFVYEKTLDHTIPKVDTRLV